MPQDLRASLAAQLRRIQGVAESPSTFGPENAFWCNGKEIAHLEGADAVDLRLTRSAIRELRAVLRSDQRVELRSAGSDWIEVHVSSTDDVAFVVEIAERAAQAHRAVQGETPKAPSVGSDLERRRRLH
jgi:hypothetical protein